MPLLTDGYRVPLGAADHHDDLIAAMLGQSREPLREPLQPLQRAPHDGTGTGTGPGTYRSRTVDTSRWPPVDTGRVVSERRR